MKGRGSSVQPVNRFTQTSFEPDGEYLEWLHQSGEEERIVTEPIADQSRSIISKNNSPDIPFDFSLNPYRGCEHGCSYCYARPSHEFLGFSAGLDFETKVLVKFQAAELLKKELSKASWGRSILVMSGVTDPYQPMEKSLRITRSCLEVLKSFRQPVEMITKNHRITRDIDLLSSLAGIGACSVRISITTLDPELGRVLEPRASSPSRRLEAIEKLARAGVPVGVNVSPVIPGLNDHEMIAIIEAAKAAGASWAHYIPLRLPGAVLPVFLSWLECYRPDAKNKVLRLVRELRGGKLNDPRFHSRFLGEGEIGRRLQQFFELGRKKAGLAKHGPELSAEHFEIPGPKQLGLFD